MTFALFLTIIGIHLAAAISPGPAFVVSVRIAVSDGFNNAAALAVGFGLGAAVWAAAAMTGIALLFELVPALFTGLKLVGAVFLLFLAFMMWRHARDPMELDSIEPTKQRTALGAARLGFLTFLSNPKSAVFFGALSSSPTHWSVVLFACLFNAFSISGWNAVSIAM